MKIISTKTFGKKISVENFKNWSHTWFIREPCALSEFDVISITLYQDTFSGKNEEHSISIYNYLSISVISISPFHFKTDLFSANTNQNSHLQSHDLHAQTHILKIMYSEIPKSLINKRTWRS